MHLLPFFGLKFLCLLYFSCFILWACFQTPKPSRGCRARASWLSQSCPSLQGETGKDSAFTELDCPGLPAWAYLGGLKAGPRNFWLVKWISQPRASSQSFWIYHNFPPNQIATQFLLSIFFQDLFSQVNFYGIALYIANAYFDLMN